MPSETNPAANGVRHGLAGSRHVLPEHRDQVIQIEKELVEVFMPESPDERELLAEMALHKFRVAEIDRQKLVRDELYKVRANEICDTQAREQFEILLEKLRQAPLVHHDAFKTSTQGASYSLKIWENMAESAAPEGPGVTIDLAWEAVLVQGRNPHVLYISGIGAWIMGRVLAASTNPEEAMAAWLAKSDARDSKTAASQARTLMQMSPAPGISRKDLHERAESEIKFWSHFEEKWMNEFNLYKTQCMATIQSGDTQLDRDARLADRYRTKSQNQLNLLQRRFDNQRAAKLKHFRWTHDTHSKEKQHSERIEVAAASLSREASARYSAIREREFNTVPRETHRTRAPIQYQCGDDIDLDDYNSDNDTNMHVQDSAGGINGHKSRKEDVAQLNRVLRTLDGGKWLKRFEQINSSELDLMMFQTWPDEILLDHPAAFGEMLVERETEPERKMRVAQLVVAAAKYRQVSNQVEKEQAERRKAGPQMKDGRYVFPLMSDLEDEIERRMAD